MFCTFNHVNRHGARDDNIEGESAITNINYARQQPSVVVVIVVPKRAAAKHGIPDGPLNKADRRKFPPQFRGYSVDLLNELQWSVDPASLNGDASPVPPSAAAAAKFSQR
jgi:hypothetical protein